MYYRYYSNDKKSREIKTRDINIIINNNKVDLFIYIFKT